MAARDLEPGLADYMRRVQAIPRLSRDLEDIAHVLRVEGDHLWLFAQADAGLGYLPSRDGSNFADGLGEQQIWLGSLQHLLINLVNPQTLF